MKNEEWKYPQQGKSGNERDTQRGHAQTLELESRRRPSQLTMAKRHIHDTYANTHNIIQTHTYRMSCLRHAGAMAWRRGPMRACTRVRWCRQIFTYTHT